MYILIKYISYDGYEMIAAFNSRKKAIEHFEKIEYPKKWKRKKDLGEESCGDYYIKEIPFYS